MQALRPVPAVAALAVALACAVAGAQEAPRIGLPNGYGTAMPSGSRVKTTLADGTDVDDYAFDGYAGMRVKAALRVDADRETESTLQLLRPDGTAVTTLDGARIRFEKEPLSGLVAVRRIRFDLDESGVWKLRVRTPGAAAPSAVPAAYTLSMRHTKPRGLRIVDTSPADDGSDPLRYAYRVPAGPGTRVAFRLDVTGGEVRFESLVSPDGDVVPLGDAIRVTRGGSVLGKHEFGPAAPLGDYEVAFESPRPPPGKLRFRWTAKPPQEGRRLKGRLAATEPVVTSGIEPAVGGPGTRVTIEVAHAVDPFDPDAAPSWQLGGHALDDVEVVAVDEAGAAVLSGTIPADLPPGTYDVVVRSSRGQVAVDPQSFLAPPAPAPARVWPDVGTVDGGFPVTIHGMHFRPGRVALAIDGFAVDVTFLEQTSTMLRFVAPPHALGSVAFSVRDADSGLEGALPVGSFRFVTIPVVARVAPGLTPILGGDEIRLEGFNFLATDRVFLETSTPGAFEELSASQTTFRDATLHTFVAPVRPSGRYAIRVEDEEGRSDPGVRTLDYFAFADFSDRLGLAASEGDDLADGWTTDLADFDGDGDLDLFVARRGDGELASASLLALFENDGTGALTDVTTSRLPAPTASDDWRADRIRVLDLTMDGRPDIVATTNDRDFPAPTLSHTRILVNEQRSEASGPLDRVFRDRTLDLMAPPRAGRNGVSASEGDNWRGLDLWVGDIDGNEDGPPSIVIVHDETKEEVDASGLGYAGLPGAGGYVFSYYWGGSRAFTWDPDLRGGQGRFRFDHQLFPRRSGTVVYVDNPPPGVYIATCSSGMCRGAFTPFTGQRLAVGDVDGNGRTDFVVVSRDAVVLQSGATSSTQVLLRGLRESASNLWDGDDFADVTPLLAALGGDSSGDVTAVARLDGYGDDADGIIVVGKRDAPLSGRALRAFRYVPPEGVIDSTNKGSFEEVTDAILPPATADDAWQASDLRAIDLDRDGRDDLVLLAGAAPTPGASALRILRARAGESGTSFVDDLGTLLEITTDPFDGHALSIGDLDDDGFPELVVTRALPDGIGAQTRAVTTRD